MKNREDQAGENLSRAFLQFRYLYHYGRKAQREQHTNHCDLRPSDVMMLFAIKSEQRSRGGVTATGLSRSMGIKTPSVNTVLSTLENKKLIRRTTDPDDRRFVLIALSEEGEAQVQRYRECYEDRIQGLVAYLGVEKSDLLVELMNEVYDYLRRKSERPPEQVRK
jgi:DNA-binding MarR family transcriptional regulator